MTTNKTPPSLEVTLPGAERSEDVLKIALGYHLNADAYRDTFPDDKNDAEYLRKGETYHRLQARTLINEKLEAECLEAMKAHAAKDPEVVAMVAKIQQKFGAKNES